jgi:hypothetical protein
MKKTKYFPIRCQQLSMEDILGADLQASVLPCKYPGLPLHYKKLAKLDIQSMMQSIGNRLGKRNPSKDGPFLYANSFSNCVEITSMGNSAN